MARVKYDEHACLDACSILYTVQLFNLRKPAAIWFCLPHLMPRGAASRDILTEMGCGVKIQDENFATRGMNRSNIREYAESLRLTQC
jgi:hypothetical protein